ncbi:MAG: TonB-dependent receptor [Pseudomonadota bacterium]
MAQDDGASIDDDSDVITVSARKKTETLLEAPIAVSVFDSNSIADRQLESIDDVARFTPGLSFSKAFGRSTERPVIRGQSNVLAGVQFGVEAGAAYFVDGVYYAGSIQNINPNEIERIEVVKGPQSALYGRNTYSGAINYITKGGVDAVEADARIRYGNNETREVSASLAVPITDALSGRFSVRRYEYGGEFRNAVTDTLVGDESSTNLSAVFDYDADSAFSARLRINYNIDNDGPLPLFLQDASNNNCAPGYRSLSTHFFIPGTNGLPFPTPAYTNTNQYFCGTIQPGQVALNTAPDADGVPNQIPGALPNTSFIQPIYNLADGTAFDGLERDQLIINFNSEYEMQSGHALRVLGGYRTEVEKTGFDSDHSPVNWFIAGPTNEPFFANTNRDDIDDWSAEVTLNSPQNQPVRWLAGLYYYDQEIVDGDITFQDRDGSDTELGTRTIENTAVYGQVEFDASDNLRVTVEGRYMEETKTDSTSPDPEATFTAFTPRVTVDYGLANGGTIYGIYAKGVKPGGLNGAVGASVGKPTYEQEESQNFEIGLKTPLADNRFVFTAAAFFIDATDVQLTEAISSPSGALNSVATNQGSGEIFGVELDLNGALNDFWTVGANYAWTDTEFTEGCDADEWILTSGGGLLTDPANQTGTDFTADFPGSGPASCSIAGRQFPLTSEHQASGFVRFDSVNTGPFGSSFFATADVTYESSKFVQVHNRAKTGEALVFGGRIGFDHENWTFSAYGQNLNNEDSLVAATRWLQSPYFFADLDTTPEGASGSAPRAFFGSLRRGAQYGLELRLRY